MPLVVIAIMLLALACNSAANHSPATPPQQVPTPSNSASSSVQQINDRYTERIKQQIGDRQKEPAEQVFKNVKIFKGIPAGRLLLIMNLGYSRALGVSCTHCHVEEDFSSDEKRPKRAAREMALMHRTINETLRGMTNLEDDPAKRAINCSTCHRGSIDPRTTDR